MYAILHYVHFPGLVISFQQLEKIGYCARLKVEQDIKIF